MQKTELENTDDNKIIESTIRCIQCSLVTNAINCDSLLFIRSGQLLIALHTIILTTLVTSSLSHSISKRESE